MTISKFFLPLNWCAFLYPFHVFSQSFPKTGLVVAYLLDSNARDTSLNTFHGTIKGPILTTGRNDLANTAYYFDGKDDYIEFPIGSALPATERTISAWIKPDYQSLLNEGS